VIGPHPGRPDSTVGPKEAALRCRCRQLSKRRRRITAPP